MIFELAKTNCAKHRATTSPIGWERKVILIRHNIGI